MTLPALKLDDLNWPAMVDAIRTRIVANSRGQWTMHGPSDSGVALLELFAYLFEQRIYWLDQVHAPLARALLALMDDAPQPTQAARTVLEFPPPQGAIPAHIDAGTLFTTTLGASVLPMTTLEPLAVLPVHQQQLDAPGRSLSLSVSGHDRSAQLETLHPVPLLGCDGGAGSFEVTVWLDRPIAAAERNGTFTLLIELDAPAACAPEWAPRTSGARWSARVPRDGFAPLPPEQAVAGTCGLAGVASAAAVPDALLGDISGQWAMHAVEVEAPAVLTFSYSTGIAAWRALLADALVDGTGGLRRSGLWRIRIPSDWAPSGPAQDGLVPYALRIECEEANYASPPLLVRMVPNVAMATQVQSVRPDSSLIEPQLDNWIKLPGQQLALDRSLAQPLEDSVQLELREFDGQWRCWLPTDDFYRHGAEDRVFVVDRPRKLLIFGDGLNGRIPVLAAASATPRARLCYLAGGDTGGNVALQQWWSADTPLAPINTVAAVGGLASESFDEANARVARDLQRVERAVTAPDHEALALGTEGVAVARAFAAVGFNPSFPCQKMGGVTTVFVVPEVPRTSDPASAQIGVAKPRMDPGALRAIGARLEARRLLTHEVYVRPASYRAVFVAVELQGVVLDEAALGAAIRALLTRHLDALVGGADGTGWPFGDPLRPTALMHQVQTVLPGAVAVTRVAIALDQPATFEDCADVSIRPHELVYLAGLTTRFERAPLAQGGLR
ncbi:putative baseplate assembly protein [Massilia sp. CCM 8733]|uniref:Baseplate assembly protein n=1 Tax=Massilia mucilaginosa TaxID=2609282 RepID=A0ABX0NSA3_9BURK|nr:putative baseplate assembly protein [Massilia mucilaginosa]NHZ89630.1 putative baseplate assembly protein [Massilia mucilaginosa]